MYINNGVGLCIATACLLTICEAATSYYHVGTYQCIGKPVIYDAVAIEAKSIISSSAPQYWCNISFILAQPDVQAFNLFIDSISVQPEYYDTIVFSLKQSGCSNNETLLNLARPKYESEMFSFLYKRNCSYNLNVYQKNGGSNLNIRLVITADRGDYCTSDFYYQCYYSRECISKSLYCDGIQNCHDKSDEGYWCQTPSWWVTSTARTTTIAYYSSVGLSFWDYALIGVACLVILAVIGCVVSCARSPSRRTAAYTRRAQNAANSETTNDFPIPISTSTASESIYHNSIQDTALDAAAPKYEAPPSYEQALQILSE